ncbi:MAG: hypothetical protein HC846_04925 [Blastocatellia bacterium]|nr:hypothetical protein [Blastocatellia bacterium]
MSAEATVEQETIETKNEPRSIREIVKDLSKPIAQKHLRKRKQGGHLLRAHAKGVLQANARVFLPTPTLVKAHLGCRTAKQRFKLIRDRSPL